MPNRTLASLNILSGALWGADGPELPNACREGRGTTGT